MAIRTRTKDSDGLQGSLFHEDINAALTGLVAVMGGAKSVGSRLFPDLSPDNAARRLLDSLNPDRVQQLSQTQVLTLLKWGRQAGHHECMAWFLEECGYQPPVPRTPEEERAELQRQYVDAVQMLSKLTKKLGGTY